ncbi:MAG TPA: hypothetical protein VFD22_01995 [Gemmatimonadaceae bacterium]|nr:hypothetical protein [Gemmatimonadaceae bacterium]
MSDRVESIRLSDWLASRTPAPPSELSARLNEVVGDSSATDNELPYALLKCGLEILSNIGEDRTAAPDLLAADALITYAMEAAAEARTVEQVSEAAIQKLGSSR